MGTIFDEIGRFLSCGATKAEGAEDQGILLCCDGSRSEGAEKGDVVLTANPSGKGKTPRRGSTGGRRGSVDEFNEIMEDTHMVQQLCEGTGTAATPKHSAMQPVYSALVIALGRMDRKRRTCVMIAVSDKNKAVIKKAFKTYIDQMEELEMKLRSRSQTEARAQERKNKGKGFEQEFIDIITKGDQADTEEGVPEKDNFGPWLQQHWDSFELSDAEKVEMQKFIDEIKKTGQPKKAYVPSHLMSQLLRGGSWSG